MNVLIADDNKKLFPKISRAQPAVARRLGKARELGFKGELAAHAGENINDVTVQAAYNLSEFRALFDGDEADWPDLIFLDLSFKQKADGIAALKFIKCHDDQDIRNIPVIMYSQSNHPEDVYQTYMLRANAYLKKQNGVDEVWNAISHWRSSEFPVSTTDPVLNEVEFQGGCD